MTPAAQPFVTPAPQLFRGQVLEERVIEERVLEECPEAPKATETVCPEDEIIEEHVIRRRVKAKNSATSSDDCAMSPQSNTLKKSKAGMKSAPSSKALNEPIETKKPKK
jgi:hypothetical protein